MLLSWLNGQKKKVKVISFTGFNGGRLKKSSNINNINENNYGRIEDSHHILMHLIMHYIVLSNKHIKNPRL